MYLVDYKMIGELVNVRYNKPTYNEGVYLATIDYTEYELKDGLSKREYDNMVNTLIEYDKKCAELKKHINEV